MYETASTQGNINMTINGASYLIGYYSIEENKIIFNLHVPSQLTINEY